ncbi:MAG: single-stranded DNA-binding protein [Victivallales bacterium]|nr:single-stranded DNA-binding protein [Victivallales bacterium]
MVNLNKVLLMGNLTREPQSKALQQNGTPICDMAMAVNRRYKTQSGEEREDVIYVDLIAYGYQADFCIKNMTKGSAVYVEGHLRLDSWQDKETGKNRSKLRVVVDNIILLDRKSTLVPEQQGYPPMGYGQPPYPAPPYGQPMPAYGYQQPPPYPPMQQPYQPLPQQPYQPLQRPMPQPAPQQPQQVAQQPVQQKPIQPQPAPQQPAPQQQQQVAQQPVQQKTTQPQSAPQPQQPAPQPQQPAPQPKADPPPAQPPPPQPSQPTPPSAAADEEVVDDVPF